MGFSLDCSCENCKEYLFKSYNITEGSEITEDQRQRNTIIKQSSFDMKKVQKFDETIYNCGSQINWKKQDTSYNQNISNNNSN